MKKIMLLSLLVVIIGSSEHNAITDNGIKVILKDDGTWAAVDSIEGEFEQATIATTESNRRVILLPERWYYIVEELHTQQAEKKDLFPGKIWGQPSKLETIPTVSMTPYI